MKVDAIRLLRTLIGGMLIGVIALTGGACTGLKEPPQSFQYYTLHYPPPEADGNRTALPAALYIKSFEASEPYSSRNMVYADNAYRRNTYAYHQWLTAPEEMVTDCFVRDLRAAQITEAVMTSAGSTKATHVITGHINSFYEDDTQQKWQAVLDLTLTVTSTGRNTEKPERRTFQKTYQTTETLGQNNALGLAQAMSQAMQRVSDRIISDLPRILTTQ